MKALAEQIAELDLAQIYGRVVGVRGLMVEVAGPLQAMSIGARVTVESTDRMIPCEVVGFAGSNALLMPFAVLEGVRRGCRAIVNAAATGVRPSIGWLGRVVNAMGEPIDGQGSAAIGPVTGAVSECAAGRPCAAPGRRTARSRGAGTQYLSDLRPGQPASPTATAALRKLWGVGNRKLTL